MELFVLLVVLPMVHRVKESLLEVQYSHTLTLLQKIKYLFQKINCIDTNISDSKDVNEYLRAIQWNLDLYQGKITNRYIPRYNNVNIKSIIKYLPKKIDLIEEDINWLHPDAYTLLLMPSTGKEILPKRLQHFLNEDSPIKDLFPEPCQECIAWKEKLRNIIVPNEDATEEEMIAYKNLLSETNINYANHLKEKHEVVDLPIKRLEEVII